VCLSSYYPDLRKTNNLLNHTGKENRENNGQLIDRMPENILHHGARDERFGASVRLPFEQLLCGQLGGERQ